MLGRANRFRRVSSELAGDQSWIPRQTNPNLINQEMKPRAARLKQREREMMEEDEMSFCEVVGETRWGPACIRVVVVTSWSRSQLPKHATLPTRAFPLVNYPRYDKIRRLAPAD